jgi:hypothetical protein
LAIVPQAAANFTPLPSVQQLSKATGSLCELPENGSAFGRATQEALQRPAEE